LKPKEQPRQKPPVVWLPARNRCPRAADDGLAVGLPREAEAGAELEPVDVGEALGIDAAGPEAGVGERAGTIVRLRVGQLGVEGGEDAERAVAGQRHVVAEPEVQDNWRSIQAHPEPRGSATTCRWPATARSGVFTSFDPKLPTEADNRPGALTYAGFGPGRINAKRFGRHRLVRVRPPPRLRVASRPQRPSSAARGHLLRRGQPHHRGLLPRLLLRLHRRPRAHFAGRLLGRLQLGRRFQPPAGFVPPPFIDPAFANGQSPWYINPRSGIQPRVKNWNITIQREIPAGFVVNAAYVGHRGSNLNSTVNLNRWTRSTSRSAPCSTATSPTRRDRPGLHKPYSSFTGTLARRFALPAVPRHPGPLRRGSATPGTTPSRPPSSAASAISRCSHLHLGPSRFPTAATPRPRSRRSRRTATTSAGPRRVPPLRHPSHFQLLWTLELRSGRQEVGDHAQSPGQPRRQADGTLSWGRAVPLGNR